VVLQAQLCHKRIDETMLYMHVAENHAETSLEPSWQPVARNPIRTTGSWRCLARVAATW